MFSLLHHSPHTFTALVYENGPVIATSLSPRYHGFLNYAYKSFFVTADFTEVGFTTRTTKGFGTERTLPWTIAVCVGVSSCAGALVTSEVLMVIERV